MEENNIHIKKVAKNIILYIMMGDRTLYFEAPLPHLYYLTADFKEVFI